MFVIYLISIIITFGLRICKVMEVKSDGHIIIDKLLLVLRMSKGIMHYPIH